MQQILKKNAANIVNEISSIINQKINVINDKGKIIASSDPSRIGSIHFAAKKMIEQKLNEIVVFYDHEYENSLAGTNTSLILNGEIIGAIGITGPYQEVIKYEKVICKMTELLIQEEYYKTRNDIEKRIRCRFLNEWFFGEANQFTQDFIAQGLLLGIDVTKKRRVFIILPILNNTKIPLVEQQHLFDNIYNSIKKYIEQDFCGAILITGNMYTCVISDRPDKLMIDFMSQLKHEIETHYPVTLAVGIDSRMENYQYIKQAYKKAEKAVKACIRSAGKKPHLYNSINMEIFAGEISEHIKKEYITCVFKNKSFETIGKLVSFLQTYYETEASITETAKIIGIHKNTVQYKLKKLHLLTGYDPRSIQFSSLFYNAIYFYHDLYDKT
ncbi:MAG: helix-turn-helix domain-containing protein [Bacteroides sp.]|nr:helix-turn-helix domain-containing protein [Prevotella sp.]MCM1407179.1 helix-turn-helix domain-containing protein [Treponema brennaborense]MCM1470331.1 helix-turn-helix domain-containing protein [Bacteroides sp.]